MARQGPDADGLARQGLDDNVLFLEFIGLFWELLGAASYLLPWPIGRVLQASWVYFYPYGIYF